MSSLIFLSVPSYSVLAGAKSSVGTRTPEHQEAFSRLNVNVAFFVPVIFADNQSLLLWGLVWAETVKAVEGHHLLGTRQLVDDSANLNQCPPYSIRTELLGIHSTKKVLVMKDKQKRAYTPEQCFTIDTSVDLSNPFDPIYTLLAGAQSLLAVLQENGADLTEGFSLNHSNVMNLLWLLDRQLEQGLRVLEGATAVPSVGGNDG